MKSILLYLAIYFSVTSLLTVLAVNVILSFAVAIRIGSRRIIGFWSSLFACLVFTAIIGLAFTLLYKIKEQQQADIDLTNQFSGSEMMTYQIRKLKLFRQTGIISKSEYEEELNRLLNE